MTTVAEALSRAGDRLMSAGVENPRPEARRLLTKAADRTPIWIYQNLRESLAGDVAGRLESLLRRRSSGEPLPYLLGDVEFYGRTFVVDDRVLVPRPETEEMLVLALHYATARRESGCPVRTGIDVGTGSGILAVSLAAELPDVFVTAIDRSEAALVVARTNRERCGVRDRVMLVLGDLLRPIGTEIDLILANLPYIPSGDIPNLQVEVQHEPRLALDGGADGLDLYRQFIRQAVPRLSSPGLLIAEIGASQGAAALELARQAFPNEESHVLVDCFGRDRFVAVERGKRFGPNPLTEAGTFRSHGIVAWS